MKVIKGISYFLSGFFLQLLLITFIEYSVFMFSPGVPESLLDSLGAGVNVSLSLIDYFTTFLRWFFRIIFKGDFGVLASSGEKISNFIWISTRITFLLIF